MQKNICGLISSHLPYVSRLAVKFWVKAKFFAIGATEGKCLKLHKEDLNSLSNNKYLTFYMNF